MTTPHQSQTPISGALKNENILVKGQYNSIVKSEMAEIGSLKTNVAYLNKKINDLEGKLKKSQDLIERLSISQFKLDREVGEIFLSLQAFAETRHAAKKEESSLIFPFLPDDDDLLN